MNSRLAAIAIALMLPVTAHAGRGGKVTCTGCSISVAMVEDLNSNGLPNHQDTITFDLVQNAIDLTTSAGPWVAVKCYQGTNFVYSAGFGFGDHYPWRKAITLSSNSWQSGAAECSATLYFTIDGTKRSTTVFSTLNFSVAP